MTAVSRAEDRHECGALGTASAAFSHCEGNKVPWVAVQSQRPGNIHRDVYPPPAGQLRHCACVLFGICSRQGACIVMELGTECIDVGVYT